MNGSKDHFLVGSIIHSNSLDDLQIIEKGFIAVRNGKIIAIGDASSITDVLQHSLSLGLLCGVTKLTDTQFLIPGFIDCHIHAPQMPNIGLGMGKPLLEWLEQYTFPVETEYADKEFARKVYEKVVKRTLKCGTTTATYFASIHKESTLELANICCTQGQRAFIGKVNMNAENPSYYREETEDSIRDTKDIVKSILGLENDLVKPIITPRFVLSCDMHLMTQLATIAKENDLHIQSHISENKSEVKVVAGVYPNNSSYANIYDEAQLLTNKTILAHGVYLTDDELILLKERGTSIAHCPSSNTCLASGLCNVRRLLKAGIEVGLATDVSGGCTPMILEVMRRALDVSQHLSLLKSSCIEAYPSDMFIEEQTPLSCANVLFLATLGGAKALSLDDKIGNFIVGKDFDALVVDINTPDSPIDIFDYTESLSAKIQPNEFAKIWNHLQKFIYTGDERNIINVFVDGTRVIG